MSVNLSDESFVKIDITSKALGLSRSKLIEQMIQKGWHFSDEMEEMVDKIQTLQKRATKELMEK